MREYMRWIVATFPNELVRGSTATTFPPGPGTRRGGPTSSSRRPTRSARSASTGVRPTTGVVGFGCVMTGFGVGMVLRGWLATAAARREQQGQQEHCHRWHHPAQANPGGQQAHAGR